MNRSEPQVFGEMLKFAKKMSENVATNVHVAGLAMTPDGAPICRTMGRLSIIDDQKALCIRAILANVSFVDQLFATHLQGCAQRPTHDIAEIGGSRNIK